MAAVKTVSIWSMAGMTVVKLGIPQEKTCVASFRSYIGVEQSGRGKTTMGERSTQLLCMRNE